MQIIWQARNVSSLAETAIYVATVDKFSDVLKTILAWVAENKEEVGEIKMDNADCILHASLEDDKEQVRCSIKYQSLYCKSSGITFPFLLSGSTSVPGWLPPICWHHKETEQRLPEEDKAI